MSSWRRLFLQGGQQAIGVVGHDAVHTGSGQHAHVRGRVDGPAHDLEVLFVGLLQEIGADQISAGDELARADLEGLLEGLLARAVIQQAGHEGRFDFAKTGKDGGIKGDNDAASDFVSRTKRADEGVFAAPEAVRFQLKVKDDIVLFGELENFFKGGDALAHELAGKPRAGIEAAEFGESHLVNGALAIGGAFYRLVVQGDEMGVASQVQISFDEGNTLRDGAAISGERIFRRVAGRTTVGDR